MSQQALLQVLRQLPNLRDPNLLVGSASADDAGVYRLDRNRALVQTVDFFTPIVDDPFCYGQIAAANSLSDVYAMGGRPLTAMNLLGIPTDVVPPKVISAILRGGAAKTKEARCVIVGGHTIRNPEPVYGLSVTGLVHPGRVITNAAARPGDLLVLTKPLGTGIVTTGIKRGLTSPALARKTIRTMAALNHAGAELGERRLVRAGTDVTGFGLLGHLGSMCRASRVGAEIFADSIPLLAQEVLNLIQQDCIPGGSRENQRAADAFTDWGCATAVQKAILCDAQTSGGLMLSVAPRNVTAVRQLLKRLGTPCCQIVGRIIESGEPQVAIRRAR